MKKRISLVIIISLALAGFGLISEAEPASTRILTDDLGRTVTIPENPQRILALTSAAMEAIYNLGLKPIGKVEAYKVRAEGIALPSVGKVQSINMEAVYALTPDLILANTKLHSVLQEEFEGTGAAVYYFNPAKISGFTFVGLTKYMGRVLHRSGEGEEFAASVFTLAEELSVQIAERRGFTTGLMLRVDGKKVLAAQSSSAFGAMLTLLGIRNIVPENLPRAQKSSYVPYDIEQIVADNPDVIFLLAQSRDQEANTRMLHDFMSATTWAALDAVKNSTVFILPFSANPNVSTAIDMLKITADVLLDEEK